jgi:NADH-quinone oxidoreductase subunit I
VDHGGKDPDYDFYAHAGVVTRLAGKGEHAGEEAPVNIRSNMP